MATFQVYKTRTCPYCHQAMAFLEALSKQRDVQIQAVDEAADPQAFRDGMVRSGRRTVPQIFLDGQHIGGWDDLAGWASSGRLDAALEGRPWKRKPWWRR